MTLNQQIAKIEKEFDEKFGDDPLERITPKGSCKEVKLFYRQAIKDVVKETIKEIVPKEKELNLPDEDTIDNVYIAVDGIVYVPKGTEFQPAETLKGKRYVIVRTYSAGVFAGYLESRKGKEVVLRNARRIWYWAGAASLSQLAMEGTSKPDECKFPQAVNRVELTEAIEILDCSKKAKESIESIKIWKE